MKQLLAVLLFHLCYSVSHAQIVINEIRTSDSNIELKNLGASTVNVGTYWLCQFPMYNQLSSITTVCGSLNLAAGATVTVDLTYGLSAADGELGLYFNSDFGNPASIIDYVEWGASGHTRSIVAQGAGQWTSGDFVPAWDDCNSLEYDGSGNGSVDWVPQDVPTMPCIENSLNGCGAMPIELISFRVLPVKDGADIKWTGVHDETIVRVDLEHSRDRASWDILTHWDPVGPKYDQGEFEHLDISSGLHYYRLMTIYMDGREESSWIEYVKMEYDADQVSIWPNPTDGILNLVFKTIDPADELSISLTDIHGKICLTQTGGREIQIDLTDLVPGVYMLEVPALGIAHRIIYTPE